MTARSASDKRVSKPTIDAVNDAVAALSDLVRSLRASAKAAKGTAKARVRELKAKAKKTGKQVAPKGRQVGRRIKRGLGRAWEVIKQGAAEVAAGVSSEKTKAPARKRARAVRS